MVTNSRVAGLEKGSIGSSIHSATEAGLPPLQYTRQEVSEFDGECHRSATYVSIITCNVGVSIGSLHWNRLQKMLAIFN